MAEISSCYYHAVTEFSHFILNFVTLIHENNKRSSSFQKEITERKRNKKNSKGFRCKCVSIARYRFLYNITKAQCGIKIRKS